MTVCIAGTGWVTPLGSDTDDVWNSLLAGNHAEPEEVGDAVGKSSCPVYRVPTSAIKELPQHPRLRRASAISRFAAAAGIAALRQANVKPGDTRLALVFGVANGGVIYTKRFYNDIVQTGADAASPLLFPETVFNAAASHLAAIIGVDGVTYTVVGDGAVGLTALQMGNDLMANEDLDYCLVVAAEEADWLLCDAYQKWRLLRETGPIELFTGHSPGTILSEGAGAVLLGRTGPVKLESSFAGAHFDRRTDLAKAIINAVKQIGLPSDSIVITSANGTFIDNAEMSALSDIVPNGFLYSPKQALGEGVGASALWQVVVAIQALKTGNLPPLVYHTRGERIPGPYAHKKTEIGILNCGLNQQVGAARLALNGSTNDVRP